MEVRRLGESESPRNECDLSRLSDRHGGGRTLPSGDEVDDRHEDGSADDRPQDGEGLPADVDQKRLRQLELVGDPRSEQGSYETEDNGDDEPAADLTGDGPAEGAANGRDDDENDEAWQCDVHGNHLGRQ
jgi:hypothetical protein